MIVVKTLCIKNQYLQCEKEGSINTYYLYTVKSIIMTQRKIKLSQKKITKLYTYSGVGRGSNHLLPENHWLSHLWNFRLSSNSYRIKS